MKNFFVNSVVCLGTLCATFGISACCMAEEKIAPYEFTPGERAVNAPSPIHQGTSIGKMSFGTLNFTHEDGTPWYPVMGELHFSRISEKYWDDELAKMKDAGIDVVATYVFWNHHEEVENAWNWEGQRNLRLFIEKCQAHGLKAWIRIGPWCHGEARNGGWPDYIQKMQKARNRNLNPPYIARVTELYKQIAAQMKGLYAKDKGPVIGIQYDNEMEYVRERDYNYMKKLYQIAQEAGMDAPFHSATRWPAANPNAREFLTGLGGYPDAPWAQHTNKFPPREVFTYRKLKPDAQVGNDYFTHSLKNMNELDLIQPVMMVELGAGNQVCYHRRPFIRDVDCPAMAYACVGSGSNALGYYMFHGGVNPASQHYPLNEARNSGYPNDCPVMNYDFQSPLSSAGLRRESFYLYQKLHRAVKCIEKELVSLPATFSKQAAKPGEAKKLRCAYRGTNATGFLFFSNVQRNLAEEDIPNVQFKINGPSPIVFPTKPVTIPKFAMGIWPVNYAVPGTADTIAYATGTLQRVYKEKGLTVLEFLPTKGVPFEIRYNTAPSDEKNVPMSLRQSFDPSKMVGPTFDLTTIPGKCILRVLNPKTEFPETLNPELVKPITLTAKDITPEGANKMPVPDFAKIRNMRQFWDLKPLPGELRYEIQLPDHLTDEVILEIDYIGDTAGLYQDNKMVDDDFYYGRKFIHRIDTKRNGKKPFILQIIPIHPEQKIYFEDDVKAAFATPKTPYGTAELKSIKLYKVKKNK